MWVTTIYLFYFLFIYFKNIPHVQYIYVQYIYNNCRVRARDLLEISVDFCAIYRAETGYAGFQVADISEVFASSGKPLGENIACKRLQ